MDKIHEANEENEIESYELKEEENYGGQHERPSTLLMDRYEDDPHDDPVIFRTHLLVFDFFAKQLNNSNLMISNLMIFNVNFQFRATMRFFETESRRPVGCWSRRRDRQSPDRSRSRRRTVS